MKTVTWKKRKERVYFSLGRNGYVQTEGLEIHHAPKEIDQIDIYPINSKRYPSRCRITIPKKAIPSLIKALSEIK